MSAKLISIIGPPASGKTVLAEALSAELPATLVREDYAGNPFLAESYAGAIETRLPSQLYFLLSRVKQLQSASWPGDGLVVTDYGFCQDAMFARLRLDRVDLETYRKVAGPLADMVHQPDVLIRLDASLEALLTRIDRRGRGFEQSMTTDFLESMRAECDTAAGEAACPVISIDTEDIDVRDAESRRDLIATLREKL